MFPNPQDALPLPPRPNIERYKKLAKDLLKASKSPQPEAIAHWAKARVDDLVRLSKLDIPPQMPVRADRWIAGVADFAQRKLVDGGSPTLATAQFVIARSHGFESWPKFVQYLDSLAVEGAVAVRFEAAADAIVSGDAATLQRLLDEDPGLVRARSGREHGATLLHYVSANGVEGYRQKTPPNIVEITTMLLARGAEIDATTRVYGGDCTTLGLTATSVHPERAGVQEALLQTLLDHGAALDRPSSAGNGQSLVIACVANGRPKAAEFLTERGAPLDLAAAAAVGGLDLVASLCLTATPAQLSEALLYAAGCGRDAVVSLLLEKGADLTAHTGDGQTALHRAAIGGHPETVRLLLGHNPPLEARNGYGGTPLGQALWSAAHGGDPARYLAILDALAAAGARLPQRYAPIHPAVDEWLESHGCRIEAGQ